MKAMKLLSAMLFITFFVITILSNTQTVFAEEIYEETETTDFGTSSIASSQVLYDLSDSDRYPFFTVKIPKTIILDNRGSGNYAVGVKGRVPSKVSIKVFPDEEVIMTSQHSWSKDITANVIAGKTIWLANELTANAYSEDNTSTIQMEKTDYETFNGILNFNISTLIEPTIGSKKKLEDWEYTLDNDNKIITLQKYIGSHPDVVAYSKYDYDGILYDTVITPSDTTNGLFSDSSFITSFKIKDGAKGIGSFKNAFANAEILTELDLENLDCSQITDITGMFTKCNSLTEITLSHFNFSSVTSAAQMFNSCANLSKVSMSHLDFSSLESIMNMFAGCAKLTTVSMSDINCSSIKDITNLFMSCNNLNEVIWDNINFSGLVNKPTLFMRCPNITEIQWSNVDFSKVTSFNSQFAGLSKLQTVTWNNVNFSNVVDVAYLFASCSNLTAVNWTDVDFSSVQAMDKNLFSSCNKLTTVAWENIDYSNIKGVFAVFEDKPNLTELTWSNINFSSLDANAPSFNGCSKLAKASWFNIDLSNLKYHGPSFQNCSSLEKFEWSGSNLSSFTGSSLFENIGAVTELILSDISVKSIKHIEDSTTLRSLALTNFEITDTTALNEAFFAYGSSIETVTIKNFSIPNVTTLKMFAGCSNLAEVSLAGIDAPRLKSMRNMFEDCLKLTKVHLENLDTSIVTDMGFLFKGCRALNRLNLMALDTSNVTDMSHMFDSCVQLQDVNLSSFNTSNVTNMSSMFYDCNSLENINVSTFDTSKAEMTSMFSSCTNLQRLDLKNFSLDFSSSSASSQSMFSGCSSLEEILISSTTGLDLDDVYKMRHLFDCSDDPCTHAGLIKVVD